MGFEDILKSIGLTGFDVRVYTTLLSLGEATLTTLEEELESHRAQLHASLKRLSSKGLIELYSGKPAMYRPVPPEVLIEVVRRTFDENLKMAENFLKNLPRKTREATHGVWIYRSSKGLMRRYVHLIEKAEKNVIVCGDAEFIKVLKDSIAKAVGRGVIAYVLLYDLPGLTTYNENQFDGLNKLKRSVSGDLLVMADSEVGVIAQRRFNAGRLPPYGVVVEEPVLIDYLEENFINRWIHSETIADKPLRPPFCLTTFKLAVLEARRLIEEGYTLRVKCVGRWRTGGEGVLSGEVVEAVYDVSRGVVQLHVRSKEGIFTAGASDAIIEDFACWEACFEGESYA
ncbi:MAG: TrmB family transcriptional regulator sugar-binding domain-containing protein [Infirmifilum sp.]